MLHVVAFLWPPSQTLVCSRLHSGILISRNYRPFIYFQLVLVRFQEFKCEAKFENSDSVAIDLQKLKDVLQNDTKYYILENIK